MTAKGPRPGEFELIARYLRPLASDPGAFGLTDDAAALAPPPGFDLVLTKDMVCAGIHFFPDDPPASIARKALRVNLSDLAAKGARPLGYMLGLALPGDWTEDWMAGFAAGLAEDQQTYSIPLLGGDTVKASGGLTLSITAIGVVPTGTTVRRSGAKPGDVIAVTGTIGDAALGLQARLGTLAPGLPEAARAFLLDRYLHPQPRTAIAESIRRHAHAAMDVSDGLIGDLGHMARASGVSATIDVDRVPFSAAARAMLLADDANLKHVLTGGDDYEILLMIAADAVADLRAECEREDVTITIIGQVSSSGAATVVAERSGVQIRLGGVSYDHFG